MPRRGARHVRPRVRDGRLRVARRRGGRDRSRARRGDHGARHGLGGALQPRRHDRLPQPRTDRAGTGAPIRPRSDRRLGRRDARRRARLPHWHRGRRNTSRKRYVGHRRVRARGRVHVRARARAPRRGGRPLGHAPGRGHRDRWGRHGGDPHDRPADRRIVESRRVRSGPSSYSGNGRTRGCTGSRRRQVRSLRRSPSATSSAIAGKHRRRADPVRQRGCRLHRARRAPLRAGPSRAGSRPHRSVRRPLPSTRPRLL
jgi:hypothetical protein